MALARVWLDVLNSPTLINMFKIKVKLATYLSYPEFFIAEKLDSNQVEILGMGGHVLAYVLLLATV